MRLKFPNADPCFRGKAVDAEIVGIAVDVSDGFFEGRSPRYEAPAGIAESRCARSVAEIVGLREKHYGRRAARFGFSEGVLNPGD
jgi:hypothetical protein